MGTIILDLIQNYLLLQLQRYGFSLEENDQRDLAEEVSYKSLALQPKNPWAIHTMSKTIIMLFTIDNLNNELVIKSQHLLDTTY